MDSINDNTMHLTELTQNQLRQLPLTLTDTILDVDAGTGRMTIPIAKGGKACDSIRAYRKNDNTFIS